MAGSSRNLTSGHGDAYVKPNPASVARKSKLTYVLLRNPPFNRAPDATERFQDNPRREQQENETKAKKTGKSSRLSCSKGGPRALGKFMQGIQRRVGALIAAHNRLKRIRRSEASVPVVARILSRRHLASDLRPDFQRMNGSIWEGPRETIVIARSGHSCHLKKPFRVGGIRY